MNFYEKYLLSPFSVSVWGFLLKSVWNPPKVCNKKVTTRLRCANGPYWHKALGPILPIRGLAHHSRVTTYNYINMYLRVTLRNLPHTSPACCPGVEAVSACGGIPGQPAPECWPHHWSVWTPQPGPRSPAAPAASTAPASGKPWRQ